MPSGRKIYIKKWNREKMTTHACLSNICNSVLPDFCFDVHLLKSRMPFPLKETLNPPHNFIFSRDCNATVDRTPRNLWPSRSLSWISDAVKPMWVNIFLRLHWGAFCGLQLWGVGHNTAFEIVEDSNAPDRTDHDSKGWIFLKGWCRFPVS